MMKAIAVYPGKPYSMHLEDVPNHLWSLRF